MTQTLDARASITEGGEGTRAGVDAGRAAQLPRRRIEHFLSELERMTPNERVRASRYSFDRWERSVWAGRYPGEAPLANGELEWIALTLE